ncbi:uncharacterized protein TNCT_104041 [Trichonephila clavata]|uniref:Uncharacterized protein n=1 Tax=Trichonephila clavata TaxID=2740835 RepID=A0A8X6IUW3_TRICU|nr:uncharacterized protein TNCT_104041 [Trichonephila clavata]
MEKGLIAASAECSVCKKAMRLVKKNSSDGYIWECRKKGANGHRMKRSVRKNSWFEESKLRVHKVFELISMLKTATAIIKNIQRTVATRYDDRNERARAAISGSAPVRRSLGNHTNLFTLATF